MIALGAALAGGVCLVAHLWVDTVTLWWVGLGLLAVTIAVVGARLVRAPWLAVVCAAGSVALAWALLEVLREAGHDREVGAAIGGLATLCVAVAMLRSQPSPAPTAPPARRHGNHRS